MKFKTIHTLIVLAIAISMMSCKTKQEIAQESQFQEEIDARAAESKLLFDQSGLDPNSADKLSETMQGIDSELMNFLATDPDADARRATLKRLMDQRNQAIKSTMTDEQYKNYIKALRERSNRISNTIGGPAKNTGG